MSETASTKQPLMIDGVPLPSMLDEAMIHDVVHRFYNRIRSDALLAPIFNRVIAPEQWPVHLNSMCDFWSSTLLRTSRYEGRPLRPHLQIPELEQQHFHRWLSLFQATLSQICPPEVEAIFMQRALRIAQSFRLSIAFHRGESTIHLCPIQKEDLAV